MPPAEKVKVARGKTKEHRPQPVKPSDRQLAFLQSLAHGSNPPFPTELQGLPVNQVALSQARKQWKKS